MYLRHMIVVCVILYLHNPAGNHPEQIFIDSKGFTKVENFSMLWIKDVSNIIKDHNLVPNQEAHLGAIQQRNIK